MSDAWLFLIKKVDGYVCSIFLIRAKLPMHPCVTFLDAQIYFLFTNESHVWFVPHLTLPNFGHAQIMVIAKIVGNILLDYSLTKI
jgi:hypothetical protein